MEYLKKAWVRVLASLFAGGIIIELIWVATATNPNAERPTIVRAGTFIAAFLIYGVLTKKVNK